MAKRLSIVAEEGNALLPVAVEGDALLPASDKPSEKPSDKTMNFAQYLSLFLDDIEKVVAQGTSQDQELSYIIIVTMDGS